MKKGYKILYEDGQAPNQTAFRYNWDTLPNDNGPGQWIECDRSRPLRICGWGFHAYKTADQAKGAYGPGRSRAWSLYEVEFDDSVKTDVLLPSPGGSHQDKFCGYRMRFVRLLETHEGKYVPLRYGDIVWQ